jgi:hypothetical protein
MKKDDIEKLFHRLEGQFDIESPSESHEQVFLKKLEGKNSGKRNNYLKPLMGIAASIAILVSVFLGFQLTEKETGLAAVSPEMAKTQHFYSTAIAKEMQKLEKLQTPENKALIADAMAQMQKLENEYAKLQKDLKESGEDRRVIFAMISNFQNRINILKNLLERIDQLEQLKQQSHEEPIVI